jgi:DNA-binding beta-propeller fold protein YncE
VAIWGREGSGPGEFRLPGGIAVDGGRRVYVSDGANQRIQVFDHDGRFVTMWGGPGTAEGRFQRPGALAVDGQGRLAVADLGNDRVQIFDRDGRFLAAWRVMGGGTLGDGSPPAALGLGFDHQGGLVVAGAGAQIQQFDQTGQMLRVWRADGPGQVQLTRPAGIAVDATGDIYVADAGGDRVAVFRVLTPTTR